MTTRTRLRRWTPDGRGVRVEVRDLWPRLMLSPPLGLAIGWASGILAPTRHSAQQTLGRSCALAAISFLVWEGNRRLYLKAPHPIGSTERPWRVLATLAGVLAAFTVSATAGLLLLWRWLLSDPDVTAKAMAAAAMLAVIGVALITHGYETVFLRRGWASERVRAACLEQARAQAELAALQGETDPHFLYNHLNNLLHLIECSPASAAEFVEALAAGYRHLLETRGHALVPLQSELEALHLYAALVRIRFKGAVRLDVSISARNAATWRVPPLCLQELAENAIKHTTFEERHPLTIRLWIEDGCLCVSNRFAPRASVATSLGVGLANLNERLRLTVGRGAQWGVAEGQFVVRVPLAAGSGSVADAPELERRASA